MAVAGFNSQPAAHALPYPAGLVVYPPVFAMVARPV